MKKGMNACINRLVSVVSTKALNDHSLSVICIKCNQEKSKIVTEEKLSDKDSDCINSSSGIVSDDRSSFPEYKDSTVIIWKKAERERKKESERRKRREKNFVPMGMKFKLWSRRMSFVSARNFVSFSLYDKRMKKEKKRKNKFKEGERKRKKKKESERRRKKEKESERNSMTEEEKGEKKKISEREGEKREKREREKRN